MISYGHTKCYLEDTTIIRRICKTLRRAQNEYLKSMILKNPREHSKWAQKLAEKGFKLVNGRLEKFQRKNSDEIEKSRLQILTEYHARYIKFKMKKSQNKMN